ncbi:MAG: putative prohead core protein protease [Prokaryotic dsDNA virus sp.]|nr:MAG: putative prohead core protein protease [Prokaryotic dsDNA virus sp.]|tara:strand:+ start:186 stop:821 length:636 start_codon:yes stop_codon:yes gene_type:complete
MGKQLLREFFELKCDDRGCRDLLTEGEKKMINEGFLIFPAKLQEAEATNGNLRRYPKMILEREIANYQKLVKEKRALGECDHPDDSVINLKNASHMVSRIWWDGNNVLGTIKVLKTPAGDILRGLYDSGVLFGFSSRAMGSLQESSGPDGSSVQIVQDDLQLICFDAVSEPSAPGAYLMREGVEKNLQEFFTKGDRINRALNEILLRRKSK